jgi:NADH-quinone oxidoreductase subunit L
MNESVLNPSIWDHPLLVISLVLPLVSFLTAVLISEKYSWAVALFCSVVMLICASTAAVFLFTYWDEPSRLLMVPWFNSGSLSISMNLLISKNSLLMLAVVMFVSFVVHMFSIGYMATDGSLRRYFGMLGFFTFSMAGIVMADNLLLIFLFWELVGFCSYMLIGHYMEKRGAARAATKAFLFNRIGDAGFIIGLMIIWSKSGTLNLSELSSGTDQWHAIAALCMFGGVIGKSAQFPLLGWLPDAMQGPTPVSALIHAATMVAAGVYLLTRIFFLFTADYLVVVALVGLTTSVLAAFAALAQFDIKKVLAYSTISQLGLMITAVGAGAVDAAFVHLLAHAFFKAGLFLCAGSVIHALHIAQQQAQAHFDVQDIRNMGGFRSKLPITFIAFTVTAASLAGVPFFSGFLSKEAMLSGVLVHDGPFALIIFGGMLVVAFLTALYSFRLVYKVFIAPGNKDSIPIYESPAVMRLPMIMLAAGSLWFVIAPGPLNHNGWIIDGTDISPWITITSLLVIAAALFSGWLMYRSAPHRSLPVIENAMYIDSIFPRLWRGVLHTAAFSENTDKKYIDKALHFSVVTQVTIAHVIAWMDSYIVDGFVNFLTNVVRVCGWFIRSLQGGKIQLYVFWAVFAIIIFLIWQLI